MSVMEICIKLDLVLSGNGLYLWPERKMAHSLGGETTLNWAINPISAVFSIINSNP